MAKMGPLLTCYVVLLACCMHSIQGDDVDERPVVNLEFFRMIRGQVRQADNGAKVNVFLGIPYGVPPVGDLRFRASTWPKKTNGTLEADKFPPACPQYSEQPLPWSDSEPDQSEDCLYVNIWAPAAVGKKKRPVKMYVHGGGWFDSGSSRMGYYDGFGEATDTMDGNGTSKEDGIIVVTFNYRLGVLGFLSTSSYYAKGNAGLEDVYQAVYWIQKIIGFFGGSNKLTLVGQGTGAILVSLFRQYTAVQFRSVLNGATFLTLQALDGVEWPGDSSANNERLGELLAKKFGCESIQTNSTSAVACLRGVEYSKLVKAASCLSRGRGPPNVFLPILKNTNSPYHSYLALYTQGDQYYKKTLHDYDTLYTFTSDAGSALLTTAFPKVFGEFGEKNLPLSAACAKKVARRFLKKFNATVVDQLLGDLDKSATLANRDKVVQAFGDAYFNCPMVFHAEDLKRVKSVTKAGAKGVVTVHLLEKQVNPPYNPWADWMGSVGFNNVQIDFLHPKGLTLNNQTYTYTDEQMKQVRANLGILRSHITREGELPFPEFTPEDPAYGFMNADGSLSDEKKSNFHSHNCEILRPHFKYIPYKEG